MLFLCKYLQIFLLPLTCPSMFIYDVFWILHFRSLIMKMNWRVMFLTQDVFCVLGQAQSFAHDSYQLLSHVQLFATPWIEARQASLSITNSWSSPKLVCIELVMPSSHLILCRPLFLLPPIPSSIRVFSKESTLHMRWPKYWSFSLSINPSNEHPGLISFRMDWLDYLDSFLNIEPVLHPQINLSWTYLFNSSMYCWILYANLSYGEGNGNSFQYSYVGNPMDRGAWRATVHGVTRVGHDLVTKPAPICL